MKTILLKITFLILTNLMYGQVQSYKLFKKEKQTYVLGGIKKTAEFTAIDKLSVTKLNAPLIALAAYYASIASTDFSDNGNELTIALGLGKQGSNAHKAIIKKWFKNESVAKRLLNSNLLLTSPGSSNFSVFEKLNFEQKNDTITIRYEILDYHHGKGNKRKGIDKALIFKEQIVWIEQNSIK